MATVVESSARTSALPSPEVVHPLDRLKSTIRRYVVLESLAIFVLYVALWFWIGLLFDFGAFKALGIDWVQELHWGFRAFALVVLAGGLIAVLGYYLFRRLAVEFRLPALAMVLEKRFPKLLGDRLITAVELADLDQAAQQGYSRAMIQQTISEAATLVDKAPIHEVFNWTRLKKLWLWAIVAAVGPFLVIGLIYSLATRTNPLTDYSVRFRDVAAIWAERDLLIRHTIWPRNAYLIMLEPDSPDTRIGRDAPSPRMRVKAVKWLIADSAAPEGWRGAKWSDLNPDLLGGIVPALPSSFADIADSLDRINMRIDQPEFRRKLAEAKRAAGDADSSKAEAAKTRLQELESLVELFEQRLPAKAAEPGMGRKFRQLEVPDRVMVVYWGAKTSNDLPLPQGENQEYSGVLSDLRESVKFRVEASDYKTPTASITLVPPPMLTQLSRNEDRPAYLFHRAPIDGGAAALKGLKQRVSDLGVSLSGPVSQFTLPAGTDVELIGQVDKELLSAVLYPRVPKGAVASPPTPLELTGDKLGFRHRFANVNVEQDFDLELTDTDKVKSRRHIRIEPVKDGPPRVNLMIDGIRKTAQGYIVTPVAQIPFAGNVVDNAGIEKIDYVLTIQQLQSASTVGAQAMTAIGAIMQFAPSEFGSTLGGAVAIHQVASLLTTGGEPKPQSYPMRSFEDVIKDRQLRDILREELERRLKQPPAERSPLVQQFEVKPQYENLDLRDRLPDLKVKEEGRIQPKYRMRLTVTATDNNVETGPGIGPNKEPPFNVLVVSEAELLVEIAKEEQTLHFKLEDAVKRLRDARQRLDELANQLKSADAQLNTMALRAQEVQDTTGKARDVVQEVLVDYQRLLREMELNRVMPKLVEKVKGSIIMPLDGSLRQEFVRAEETQDNYRKTLEAGRNPDDNSTRQVQQALDQLIDRLSAVMDAMGEVATINQLITKLREIEKAQEGEIGAALQRIKKEQERRIQEVLDKLDKP